jgi:hypothetical protein
MAHFEMWLGNGSGNDPRFVKTSDTEASLSILRGAIHSVKVALRDGLVGSAQTFVRANDGSIAKVEAIPVNVGDNDRLFEVTGQKAGATIIEATAIPLLAPLATLSVIVQEPPSASQGGVPANTRPQDLDPRLLATNNPFATLFAEGFIEGVSKTKSTSVDIAVAKIKAKPLDFYIGYLDGAVVGMYNGAKDLVEGLVSIAKIAVVLSPVALPFTIGYFALKTAFDKEFRDGVKANIEWAKAVGEAAKAVTDEFSKDKAGAANKYLGATREAGLKLGEAFAAEIDEKVPLASAFDFGMWVGWVVGRVLFEIIFLVITDGVGEAVKGASMAGEGAKGVGIVGKGSEIIIKMKGKLQGILDGLPALKQFVQTLLKSKSAAQAAEAAEAAAKAKVVAEALEAAARARKAAEAADAAAKAAKAAGAADAADAAAKAKDAAAFAEAAKNAKTSAEATEAANKAKAAADAAEAAAKKATSAANAAAKAGGALLPYVNLDPEARPIEIALGEWLDQQAQRGTLLRVGRVRGMPRNPSSRVPGVPGGQACDYHFLPTGATDARLVTGTEVRADAVISPPQFQPNPTTAERKFENLMSQAFKKAGGQTDVAILEIGAGDSAKVTDEMVNAWTHDDFFKTSPAALKRVIVVRNNAGVRTLIRDIAR